MSAKPQKKALTESSLLAGLPIPRKGKKIEEKPLRTQMTVLIKKEARQQLRILCATKNRTQQELFAEALNLLFEQEGIEPVA